MHRYFLIYRIDVNDTDVIMYNIHTTDISDSDMHNYMTVTLYSGKPWQLVCLYYEDKHILLQNIMHLSINQTPSWADEDLIRGLMRGTSPRWGIWHDLLDLHVGSRQVYEWP